MTGRLKVKVVEGWSVTVDGHQLNSTDAVVQVDATIAAEWIANGWVTPAPPKRAARKQATAKA